MGPLLQACGGTRDEAISVPPYHIFETGVGIRRVASGARSVPHGRYTVFEMLKGDLWSAKKDGG
jgi:hypothetical protein